MRVLTCKCSLATEFGWGSFQTEVEQKEYIKGMHLLKTDLFMDMIETGALPLRPGVAR